MFYKQRVLANFERFVPVEKTARFVPVASAAVTISLFGIDVQVGPTSMLLLYHYIFANIWYFINYNHLAHIYE